MHRSLAKDNLQNTSKLYVNQIVRRFYGCSKNNKMQIKFIKVVPFKFFLWMWEFSCNWIHAKLTRRMNEYRLLYSEVLWLDASKSYMSVYVVSKHIMFRVTLYDTISFSIHQTFCQTLQNINKICYAILKSCYPKICKTSFMISDHNMLWTIIKF